MESTLTEVGFIASRLVVSAVDVEVYGADGPPYTEVYSAGMDDVHERCVRRIKAFAIREILEERAGRVGTWRTLTVDIL